MFVTTSKIIKPLDKTKKFKKKQFTVSLIPMKKGHHSTAGLLSPKKNDVKIKEVWTHCLLEAK